jgi:hypothetical protein
MIQDLVHGWRELTDAGRDYDEAEKYSKGNVEEVFASDIVRMALRETGERYRFNLAKTPIGVLADSLSVTAVTVPGNDPATNRVTEIWKANDLDVGVPTWIRKTLTFGDSYVMAWPIFPEEDPELEAQEPGDLADTDLVAAGVELTYQDPRHCRVIYDEENERRKSFALKRWRVRLPSRVAWRVDLYYPDVIERWISVEGTAEDAPEGWVPFMGEDEEEWELPNPFGEIPFFHFRTDMPYGEPVHAGAYGPQDAITKMLVTQITTTDSHGFPQRYGLLDESAVLDAKNDEPNWDEDGNAVGSHETLSGVHDSAQRSGPGTMQHFEGMKEVGQFGAADPKVFTDPVELYVRLMAQITNTPLHYFDPSGDVPSGESLRTAEGPKIKKAQWIQKMFRSPMVELWVFSLRLLSIEAEEVDIRWAPVESATGVEDWSVVDAKMKAGVPQAQALVEAGYDPDTVGKWLDQQANAMALRDRVELLNMVGDAVTKLGQAIALGAIDQAKAGQVVDQILGQAIPKPGSEEF